MCGTLPSQVANLSLDLGLDVERLAATRHASPVACDHHVPDLGEERRVELRSRQL
jgi:hypothetical protein